MTAESIVKKLVTDNCLYSIDRKLNYDLRYSECKKKKKNNAKYIFRRNKVHRFSFQVFFYSAFKGSGLGDLRLNMSNANIPSEAPPGMLFCVYLFHDQNIDCKFLKNL